VSDQLNQILAYINSQPELTSMLYDTDLLPEQTMRDPRQFLRTVLVTELHKRANIAKATINKLLDDIAIADAWAADHSQYVDPNIFNEARYFLKEVRNTFYTEQPLHQLIRSKIEIFLEEHDD
jgi:hypothetical protein